MNATAETMSPRTIPIGSQDLGIAQMLVLVQGDVVIATFPEHQTNAAIDFARVLCRALAQPVDLFRIHSSKVERVKSGAIAHTADPRWIHLAQLYFTFLVGVEIKVHDQDLREKMAAQPILHQTSTNEEGQPSPQRPQRPRR